MLSIARVHPAGCVCKSCVCIGELVTLQLASDKLQYVWTVFTPIASPIQGSCKGHCCAYWSSMVCRFFLSKSLFPGTMTIEFFTSHSNFDIFFYFIVQRSSAKGQWHLQRSQSRRHEESIPINDPRTPASIKEAYAIIRKSFPNFSEPNTR